MDRSVLHTCELCGRSPLATTTHHLVPRAEGGARLPTVRLCRTCHRQIHALYTNRELVQLGLTSVESLRNDERLASYLKWIAKQPPETEPRVRKSARVRDRR